MTKRAKELLAEASFANGLDIKFAYNNNTEPHDGPSGCRPVRKVGINAVLNELPGWRDDGCGRTGSSTPSAQHQLRHTQPRALPDAVAQGSLNMYGSEDPARKLIDDASNLPLAEAGDAWKRSMRRSTWRGLRPSPCMPYLPPTR